MTRLDLIARSLAAAMSPQGEDDWQRFLPMAEEVGRRLDRQLVEIMVSEPASSGVARPPGHASSRPGKPPSGWRM